MTKGRDDYEVGYGKPPVHTRFKPGESGNRRGRPKGAGNFSKDLEAVLQAKVSVSEDGRPRKVSTQLAALMRLREKALRGDRAALDRLLAFAQKSSEEREANAAERQLGANEEDILARFEADVRKKAVAYSPGEEGGDPNGNL